MRRLRRRTRGRTAQGLDGGSVHVLARAAWRWPCSLRAICALSVFLFMLPAMAVAMDAGVAAAGSAVTARATLVAAHAAMSTHAASTPTSTADDVVAKVAKLRERIADDPVHSRRWRASQAGARRDEVDAGGGGMFLCWNSLQCGGKDIPRELLLHAQLGMPDSQREVLAALLLAEKRFTHRLPGVQSASGNNTSSKRNEAGKRTRWWWVSAAGATDEAQPTDGWSVPDQLAASRAAAAASRPQLRSASGASYVSIDADAPLLARSKKVDSAGQPRTIQGLTPMQQLKKRGTGTVSGTAVIGAGTDTPAPVWCEMAPGSSAEQELCWELADESAVRLHAHVCGDAVKLTAEISSCVGSTVSSVLAQGTAKVVHAAVRATTLCHGDGGPSTPNPFCL